MSNTKILGITDGLINKTLNWEVILRTDEHVVQAISELVTRNALFRFDIKFMTSLVDWFNRTGRLTEKQSQAAIKSLSKRYSNQLQRIYDAEHSSFKAYIDSTTNHLNEELVEIISEFNTMMDCPICDKHKINTGSFPIITTFGEPDRQTVVCDKCHTTITFQQVENES